MKKWMLFSLVLAALLSICCLAFADTCIVASMKPNGYCYLYDKPSSSQGENLGRYDNGAWIDILDWNADTNFAYVMTCDSKVGYMRKSSMISIEQCYDLCYVNSMDPYGYCYLYDMTSSVNGRNLGRYDNGSPVAVLDWYEDKNFAKVYTIDNQVGYIRKTSLTFCPPDDPGTNGTDVYYVSGTPKGYCYLYDRPSSSSSSRNLGRYNDGSAITVLDYNADKTYAYVQTSDGSVGYIRKAYLSK